MKIELTSTKISFDGATAADEETPFRAPKIAEQIANAATFVSDSILPLAFQAVAASQRLAPTSVLAKLSDCSETATGAEYLTILFDATCDESDAVYAAIYIAETLAKTEQFKTRGFAVSSISATDITFKRVRS